MVVLPSLQDTQLVKLLQSGSLGVLPTDTLYGVVCPAANPQAVARLYALKSRERKPGTVIAANVEQLQGLGVASEQLAAVRRFWPGPVSVVLDHDLSFLHQGVGNQPFRIPADPGLRKLLAQTGPLLTSSANLPGQPPATNLTEAQAYFGDQVDFYVEGGQLTDRQPSTIIRLMPGNRIQVLRQGAVAISSQERN